MRAVFLPDFSSSNPYQRLLADALRANGVEVRLERAYRRQPFPILAALARRPRADVLHLHWTHPYVDWPARWPRAGQVSRARAARYLVEVRAARRAGVPVVWTVHNLFKHERPDPSAEVRFNEQLAGECDASIVHCEAARSRVIETYRLGSAERARLHVVGHGSYDGVYPEPRPREDVRAGLGLPTDARVLAFVGQIRPYKGVPALIRAFREVADPGARLVVAGEPNSPALQAEIRHLADGDPRVHARLEFVADQDLADYLGAADAVVFPFLEILTSSTVVLGMTFGKAVVAPRRGCVAETLDDSGAVLYDADDPTALPAALRQALGSDLRSMGEHNRRRSEALRWDRIGEQTRAVYQAARAHARGERDGAARRRADHR